MCKGKSEIVASVQREARIKLMERNPVENKLYIGNLAYSATETDLTEMFSQAGVVKSATVITERETGRSKGFGFVEMGSAEEAQKAITLFHNTQVNNRALIVNIARPREERGPSSRSGGSYPFGGRDTSGRGPRDDDRNTGRRRW